jgi:hypothetical protein
MRQSCNFTQFSLGRDDKDYGYFIRKKSSTVRAMIAVCPLWL